MHKLPLFCCIEDLRQVVHRGLIPTFNKAVQILSQVPGVGDAFMECVRRMATRLVVYGGDGRPSDKKYSVADKTLGGRLPDSPVAPGVFNKQKLGHEVKAAWGLDGICTLLFATLISDSTAAPVVIGAFSTGAVAARVRS